MLIALHLFGPTAPFLPEWDCSLPCIHPATFLRRLPHFFLQPPFFFFSHCSHCKTFILLPLAKGRWCRCDWCSPFPDSNFLKYGNIFSHLPFSLAHVFLHGFASFVHPVLRLHRPVHLQSCCLVALVLVAPSYLSCSFQAQSLAAALLFLLLLSACEGLWLATCHLCTTTKPRCSLLLLRAVKLAPSVKCAVSRHLSDAHAQIYLDVEHDVQGVARHCLNIFSPYVPLHNVESAPVTLGTEMIWVIVGWSCRPCAVVAVVKSLSIVVVCFSQGVPHRSLVSKIVVLPWEILVASYWTCALDAVALLLWRFNCRLSDRVRRHLWCRPRILVVPVVWSCVV